jgi:hypothetical protein
MAYCTDNVNKKGLTMRKNSKMNAVARIFSLREKLRAKSPQLLWMVPLAFVMVTATAADLGVRLGVFEAPSATAEERATALIPYEAPTIASIGGMLLSGVVKDANAVACHPSVSTC